MTLPPAESCDGYLTEEWLKALREHPFDAKSAAVFLVEDLPRIVEVVSCCLVRVEDGINDFDTRCKFVEFHTGGWSGAEDLINIVTGHLWIRHLHSKWERGGHFYFEVPMYLFKDVG